MSTAYDDWLPIARKIIGGLSSKPGILIADKAIAAQLLAQALYGASQRGEFTTATAAAKKSATYMRGYRAGKARKPTPKFATAEFTSGYWAGAAAANREDRAPSG